MNNFSLKYQIGGSEPKLKTNADFLDAVLKKYTSVNIYEKVRMLHDLFYIINSKSVQTPELLTSTTTTTELNITLDEIINFIYIVTGSFLKERISYIKLLKIQRPLTGNDEDKRKKDCEFISNQLELFYNLIMIYRKCSTVRKSYELKINEIFIRISYITIYMYLNVIKKIDEYVKIKSYDSNELKRSGPECMLNIIDLIVVSDDSIVNKTLFQYHFPCLIYDVVKFLTETSNNKFLFWEELQEILKESIINNPEINNRNFCTLSDIYKKKSFRCVKEDNLDYDADLYSFTNDIDIDKIEILLKRYDFVRKKDEFHFKNNIHSKLIFDKSKKTLTIENINTEFSLSTKIENKEFLKEWDLLKKNNNRDYNLFMSSYGFSHVYDNIYKLISTSSKPIYFPTQLSILPEKWSKNYSLRKSLLKDLFDEIDHNNKPVYQFTSSKKIVKDTKHRIYGEIPYQLSVLSIYLFKYIELSGNMESNENLTKEVLEKILKEMTNDLSMITDINKEVSIYKLPYLLCFDDYKLPKLSNALFDDYKIPKLPHALLSLTSFLQGELYLVDTTKINRSNESDVAIYCNSYTSSNSFDGYGGKQIQDLAQTILNLIRIKKDVEFPTEIKKNIIKFVLMNFKTCKYKYDEEYLQYNSLQWKPLDYKNDFKPLINKIKTELQNFSQEEKYAKLVESKEKENIFFRGLYGVIYECLSNNIDDLYFCFCKYVLSHKVFYNHEIDYTINYLEKITPQKSKTLATLSEQEKIESDISDLQVQIESATKIYEAKHFEDESLSSASDPSTLYKKAKIEFDKIDQKDKYWVTSIEARIQKDPTNKVLIVIKEFKERQQLLKEDIDRMEKELTEKKTHKTEIKQRLQSERYSGSKPDKISTDEKRRLDELSTLLDAQSALPQIAPNHIPKYYDDLTEIKDKEIPDSYLVYIPQLDLQAHLLFTRVHAWKIDYEKSYLNTAFTSTDKERYKNSLLLLRHTTQLYKIDSSTFSDVLKNEYDILKSEYDSLKQNINDELKNILIRDFPEITITDANKDEIINKFKKVLDEQLLFFNHDGNLQKETNTIISYDWGERQFKKQEIRLTTRNESWQKRNITWNKDGLMKIIGFYETTYTGNLFFKFVKSIKNSPFMKNKKLTDNLQNFLLRQLLQKEIDDKNDTDYIKIIAYYRVIFKFNKIRIEDVLKEFLEAKEIEAVTELEKSQSEMFPQLTSSTLPPPTSSTLPIPPPTLPIPPPTSSTLPIPPPTSSTLPIPPPRTPPTTTPTTTPATKQLYKRFKVRGTVIKISQGNMYDVEYFNTQSNKKTKIENAVSHFPLFKINEPCDIQVEIYTDSTSGSYSTSAYITKIQPQRTSQLPTPPLTSQQILESDELPTPPPTTTKKPRKSSKLLPNTHNGGNKCLIKYTVENT